VGGEHVGREAGSDAELERELARVVELARHDGDDALVDRPGRVERPADAEVTVLERPRGAPREGDGAARTEPAGEAGQLP
jgi:hypothetical protein